MLGEGGLAGLLPRKADVLQLAEGVVGMHTHVSYASLKPHQFLFSPPLNNGQTVEGALNAVSHAVSQLSATLLQAEGE